MRSLLVRFIREPPSCVRCPPPHHPPSHHYHLHRHFRYCHHHWRDILSSSQVPFLSTCRAPGRGHVLGVDVSRSEHHDPIGRILFLSSVLPMRKLKLRGKVAAPESLTWPLRTAIPTQVVLGLMSANCLWPAPDGGRDPKREPLHGQAPKGFRRKDKAEQVSQRRGGADWKNI